MLTKTSKTPLLLSAAYGLHCCPAHLCLKASSRTKTVPSMVSPGETQISAEEKTLKTIFCRSHKYRLPEVFFYVFAF